MLFQWERRSHTFSFQTVYQYYFMDFTWLCNANVIMCSQTSDAFLNFFNQEKALTLTIFTASFLSTFLSLRCSSKLSNSMTCFV